MTQPIQEPGPSTRTDARATWATNQLFRRPAPISTEGLPYCWMRWVGSAAVTANTLYNPVSDSPYEESFIYDPQNLADFDLDMTTGCVSWTNEGEYYVHATAEFTGTLITGNLAIVVDLGSFCAFSTNRVTNMIVADTINENMQIPVSRFVVTIADDSISTRVYHTDPSGNDLGAVWVHVVQISPSIDGQIFT